MGSTAPAVRPLERQTSDSYVWTFSRSPVKIHLRLEVISQLRRCLIAAPSDRIEQLGLLFGHAQGNRLDVTGFERFPTTRHRDSRRVETEWLAETLRRSRLAGTRVIVGYFRCTEEKDIRLRPDDLSLIHEYFRDPMKVFLVIRRDNAENATAGFFFWEGDLISGDRSFLEFPFHERLLSGPGTVDEIGEAENEAKPVAKPMGWLRTRSALVLSFLAIVAILAAYLWFSSASLPPVGNPGPRLVLSSPMYLSASRNEKNVVIVWNSALPAVAEARIGVLTIKDRETEVEYALTKSQLQANKLIYNSENNRMEITLEVFSPLGKSTKEAVVFVDPEQTSRSRNSGRLARIAQALPSLSSQPVTKGETNEESRPTIRGAANGAARDHRFTASNIPSQSSPVQHRPSQVAQPGLMTDAPTLGPVAGLEPANLKTPDFLAPSSLVLPMPKRPSDTASGLGVRPAVAIRQVRPVVPSSVSALLKRKLDIKVRVSVDVNGTVVAADPILPPGGVNQYLATAAANAARLWIFQPARRGDVALPGEVILQFSFGPEK